MTSNQLVAIVGVFAISAAVSWFALKYLIQYLLQQNIVDRPNERTMHQGVIPRGGGLIIVVMTVLTLLGLAIVSTRPMFFSGLASLVSAWAALSWFDDKLDLTPKFRFITQFLISVATVFLFGWVNRLYGFDLAWMGPVLSVVGVLWMANLYNFMDGMDGLAASQSIVASVTFGTWFAFFGDWGLVILCCVVCASSYAFLLWNWQPAKIFMGDVGSISLGALFATIMIIASNRYGIPIISSVFVFAVFISDATFTILNRIRKGEKFWLPHRSHFYQRAGLAGAKHSNIVIVATILMLLSSLIATLSVLYRDIIAQLFFVILLLLAAAALWVRKLEKQASQRSLRN